MESNKDVMNSSYARTQPMRYFLPRLNGRGHTDHKRKQRKRNQVAYVCVWREVASRPVGNRSIHMDVLLGASRSSRHWFKPPGTPRSASALAATHTRINQTNIVCQATNSTKSKLWQSLVIQVHIAQHIQMPLLKN
jgi:hypothetical protein